MTKPLPMEMDDLDEVIATFSDQYPRSIKQATDAILAEYHVPQSMFDQLARRWVMDLIAEYRAPPEDAEEDDDL